MITYRREDHPSVETECAWCGMPRFGHGGRRSHRGDLPPFEHAWTAPGTKLITDRGRFRRGLAWRTALFERANGTLVRRMDAPDESRTPRAPVESNAEATEEGRAYPSDPPDPSELLRRAQDFDFERCPSEIRRHDGRYRCTLGRPHPDPHSAHGVTWTDDDPRIVITGIGLPVRQARDLDGCPSRIAHESGTVVRCTVDHDGRTGEPHGNRLVRPVAVWADDDDRVILDTLNIPLRDALNLSWAEAERVAVEALNDAEARRTALAEREARTYGWIDDPPAEARTDADRIADRLAAAVEMYMEVDVNVRDQLWPNIEDLLTAWQAVRAPAPPVRTGEVRCTCRWTPTDTEPDGSIRYERVADPAWPPCRAHPPRRAQTPPVAIHGCDDCSVEPGEPHRWPGCPGARRTDVDRLTALGVIDRTAVTCGECGDGKALKPGSRACPACGAPPYCCEPGCEEHA